FSKIHYSTTRRLTAAAVEIFNLFQQTIVQYQEKIDRRHRLLDVIFQPQDLGTSQTGALPVVTLESETLKVPSVEEQSDQSEPEEEPDTEQLLSQDSEVHHENKLTDFPVSEKQAECEETCGEPVRKKPKLCQKVRTVTDKKRTCDTCGKNFSRQNLLVHMRTHTGEKPYSCDSCGKSFTRQRSLLVHMRIHRGEKPYSCETCGQSFSRQSYVLVHMRTHTGEKPYFCETCGKSFSQQNSMLVHMRIHTDEKPHSCETCGKSFRNKSHLSSHMRTHTGEKPYFCETCGKSFSQQRSLLGHMRTHSAVEFSSSFALLDLRHPQLNPEPCC
uniref:C2H2-type domain-containing protein n=1 Tax=Salarias fasciatus TaxID=181472 RepID=A0A672H2K8_SALFA